ncbi:hypothetical protein LR48_Vigan10g071700 [Vigna angularis]|uniref:Putative plant transposon protein domain-containing protein n=1 Tax=Phaseolus angularis TaxID=3914 RepID=A0A0L9VIC8_PHAAN|nr:hypothetical protein LR48_Vigan10g071700 [Vigna angularis]
MERKVAIIPSLAPQFERELDRRNWRNVASYPTPANIVVVEEFYTNVRAMGGEKETYMSYVRGKKIFFNDYTVNPFLGTNWDGEQCQFALSMEEGVYFDEAEWVLCVLGGHFQRNRQGAPIHLRRCYLTALAKYWMAFTHANIQPCSHVSDITTHRAIFLFYVLRGLNINIGQVIADEIQNSTKLQELMCPHHHWSGFKVNLMKEVKKDKDGIRKELKNCKRREAASTAQRQFIAERHSRTHVGSAEG